jgi:hypothetical protein
MNGSKTLVTERYMTALRAAKCKQSLPAERREALEAIADIGTDHINCAAGRMARRTMLRSHGWIVDHSHFRR